MVSAIVTYLFLSFLGVPFSISLAIWVGILSQFVPVVGTYLASILPAIVALTFNDVATAIWVVLFFASLCGALVGVTLMTIGRRSWASKLPFGTFLAVSAYAASIIGGPLVEWYVGLYR